jgi:hypothetical protein
MDMNRLTRIQHLSKQMAETHDAREKQKLEDEIEQLEDEIEQEAESEYAYHVGGHYFV